MSAVEEVRAQLAEEIGARSYALGALLGVDAMQAMSHSVEQRAPIWAAQLVQDDDDRLAAQTVIDVMAVLWPTEPPAEWWRTPLGRVCARSIGTDDAEAVTHAVAAAMLGVARGAVGVMVSRGNLDRHPDGGVVRASVLARLARNS